MKLSTLKHPLVYVSLLIFLFHQIIEKGLDFSIPIVHAYLDDLLCMPVVLGFTTQIMQWIHPVKELHFLDQKAVILVVVSYSILFEGILPQIDSTRYTADGFDILFYTLGAFLFYKLISKKVKAEYLNAL